MDPVSKKIVASHDVIFYEVSTLYPSSVHGETSEPVHLTDSNIESSSTKVVITGRGSVKPISQNDSIQVEITTRRTLKLLQEGH